MTDQDSIARLSTNHEVSYCAFVLSQQNRLSGSDITNQQRIVWLRTSSSTRTRAKENLVAYVVALFLARGRGNAARTFIAGTELSDCVDNPAIAGRLLSRARRLSYYGCDLEWFAIAVSIKMRSHESALHLQAEIVKSYSIPSLMIVPVRAEVSVS